MIKNFAPHAGNYSKAQREGSLTLLNLPSPSSHLVINQRVSSWWKLASQKMFGKACSLVAIAKLRVTTPSYASHPFTAPLFDTAGELWPCAGFQSDFDFQLADETAVGRRGSGKDSSHGWSSRECPRAIPRCDETEQTIVKPIFGLPCKDYQSYEGEEPSCGELLLQRELTMVYRVFQAETLNTPR